MRNGRKILRTQDVKFTELCLPDSKFLIPFFQRAFEWKNKQIGELWDSIISSEPEYFIGVMVLLDKSKQADDRYIIVDGQQRLITISLFLSAIKNEFNTVKVSDSMQKKGREKHVKAIESLLKYSSPSNPLEESLRLLPSRPNLQKVFSEIVEDPAPENLKLSAYDENQKTYLRGYNFIQKLVKEYTDGPNKYNKLSELYIKVSSQLLIQIICQSDGDAYELFEGLNATGLGLTVADLVKNAVMQAASKASKSSVETIEKKWEEIEKVFENTKIPLFPRFLRHQWISREGYITAGRLYDEIKANKLQGRSYQEISDYTEEILRDAEVYAGFRFDRYEHFLNASGEELSKHSVELIKTFRFLDIEQAYELLLAYFNKFKSDKNYSTKQLENDLDKLLTFCLRARFISINPSDYERKFADHCVTVHSYKKKHTDRMSLGFYKTLAGMVDRDDEFKENFVLLAYKPNSDNRFIQYILETIFAHEEPTIKISKPTIEHILPRDPTGWGLKLEDVESYVNKIGNLTLLHEKDNQKLGNSPMKDKVTKVYSKSHFKMNKELGKRQKEFEQDPGKAIERRDTELAKIASRIWKL